MYKRKKIKNSLLHVYYCPFFKSCNCSVQSRFTANEVDGTFKLERNSSHDSNSHVNYKGKFLAPCQKAAVARAVQNVRKCTGNTVIRCIIRNMVNNADEWVQIDHSLKDSVDRLVRAKRDLVLSKNLGGMKVAGNRNDEVQKMRKTGGSTLH